MHEVAGVAARRYFVHLDVLYEIRFQIKASVTTLRRILIAMANGSDYLCYIIASDKTKLSSKIMMPITRQKNYRTFRMGHA